MRGAGGWPWIVMLGLVGAAAGGMAGWHTWLPIYRSESLLSVKPIASTAEPHGGGRLEEGLEGFAALQVHLLGSATVARMALDTPTWKKAGDDPGRDALDAFQSRCSVERLPAYGTNIRAWFDAAEPTVAAAGIRALIEAYLEISATLESADLAQLRAAVAAKIDARCGEILGINQDVMTRAAPFGGLDGLVCEHESVLNQAVSLRRALSRLREEIRETEARGEDPRASKEPTLEAIALQNPTIAGHLLDLTRSRAKAEYLSQDLQPKAEPLVALRVEIQALEAHVEALARAWRLQHAVSPEQLRAREARLVKSHQALVRRGSELGCYRAELRDLAAAREQAEKQLEHWTDRQRSFEERARERRIAVVVPATDPVIERQEERTLRAIVGAGLGALAGILVGVVVGWLRRDGTLRATTAR